MVPLQAAFAATTGRKSASENDVSRVLDEIDGALAPTRAHLHVATLLLSVCCCVHADIAGRHNSA